MSISRNTRAVWRRSLIAITAGGVIAAGLVVGTATSASAHQGNIKVSSAKCVDADTMEATYVVTWASVPSNARNTVIGSRTGTTTFNSGWDDSPAAATAWANVNRGAAGSESGTRSWTVTIEKSQFSGSNGPWEYAHFPWTNGTTSSRYHDTRVENFDWNKCASTAVKDASASISITPATCDSPEKLVLGQAVNATWGTPTRTTGPGSYSVVATGNVGPPQHLFSPGSGVSTDGKTQTFTGDLKGVDTSQNCWVKDAAASVTVSPATCDAPGTASVTGLQNATLVGTLDQSVGTHVAQFQSDNGHLFQNGTDTYQVSYIVPAQDTSQACNPPKAKKVRGAVKKIDKCELNNFVFLKKVKGLHYVMKGKVVREGVWVKVKAKVVKIKVKADSGKYQVVGKKLFMVTFPDSRSCYNPPNNPPNSGG